MEIRIYNHYMNLITENISDEILGISYFETQTVL